jgi:hypothetical protein
MTANTALVSTDKIHGIDRYEYSKFKGELVVPVALLWKSPGIKAAAKNLTGAVAHGYEVSVRKVKKHKGRNFYFVSADIGGNVQAGWISAMLLEKLGAHEMELEQKAIDG